MGNIPKLTVIGGGVGGYPAAIHAARQGAAVTLIERERLGGTCLNWGCIPTKSLLHAGEVIETIKDSSTFGIMCKGYTIDFQAIMRRKTEVVDQLRRGVESLLKAKKIKIIKGTAEFVDVRTVRVRESGEKLESDGILIASGSLPQRIDFPGSDESILDSNQVLELSTLPKRVLIIGGGVIGVEFAQIFKRFGSAVTIVEMLDRLVPGIDEEIAKALEQGLVDDGIEIVTGARVKKIIKHKSQSMVYFSAANEDRSLTADKVILAVGRKPNLDGMNLDRIGLATENGAIVVDSRMQTNIPNIYAAGDVTGGIMLAHAASAEGLCAATNLLGGMSMIQNKAIPSCIYTSPEVATVGLSEEAARQVADIQIGRFPFYACGKALVLNRTRGIVKIISDKKYGEVLGVHIYGPHATDMIAEAVLGMTMEMTVEELAHAIHPHPSLSEAIMESALSLCGGAVHIP